MSCPIAVTYRPIARRRTVRPISSSGCATTTSVGSGRRARNANTRFRFVSPCTIAAAPPNAGVIAAVTDAEEIGLIGADRLAAAFEKGFVVGDGGPKIHSADINAIVNLDACSARASDVQGAVFGVARQDAPVFSWRAMVSSESPITGPFLARFAARRVFGAPVSAAVFKPVAAASLSGRQRTDVAPFEERGIPFVWPVAGYPEYHTDGDTLAAVDPVDLENVAEAAAELAGDLGVIALPRVPEPLR